jgi:tetratricopeptide (TPR) repeat protein
MKFRTTCLLLVIACLFSATSAHTEEAAANDTKKASTSDAKPTVCLHTEYMPLKDDAALKYRLMRELGRQAVLIAARDELGITTRDETLGEVFPDAVTRDKRDLFAAVRSQYDGTVEIHLWPASKPVKIPSTKKKPDHVPNVIAAQTKYLEPMIRGELRNKLRELGFEGNVRPPNEKNVPPTAVEDALLEMNFISQFGAVREAHAAMAEKGPSRAWLSVLARGYANLALLTEHHWKSDNEVFAARALLYAERLVAADPNDSIGHASRAYASAVIGLHAQALDELKRIEDLRKQPGQHPPLPDWLDSIKPYCAFEREPLADLAEKNSKLRQLVQRLSYEQYLGFGDDLWTFASAQKTIEVCPEEYSVYATLTQTRDHLLAVVRTGAYGAPDALNRYLPDRIALLPHLPPAIYDAATALADAKNRDATAQPLVTYKIKTIPIVESLRADTKRGNDKGEPSWSALGELIYEELFVQAANYLNTSLNATESSHADDVKAMLAALKNHRYARHIESYGIEAFNDPKVYLNVIGDMQVVDPRGNMEPMFHRIWQADSGNGEKHRGYNASWNGYFDRSLTYNGMLESFAGAKQWWELTNAGTKKAWSNEFREISPHSPQPLRIEIALTEKPSYKQVRQWEAQAGEDPKAYRNLGQIYLHLAHYDDSVRAFERAIALSPNKGAFVDLAKAHRTAGLDELWLPTLERIFQTPPLGLEHAGVHEIIAKEFLDNDKPADAEPHAIAAGKTYAQWGLALAGRVEEQLGHWQESEKWMRAESESYPSTSGYRWYFWCRRTGRGDLESSRKLALDYFKQPYVQQNVERKIWHATFHELEGDKSAAIDDLKTCLELHETQKPDDPDKAYPQMHLALVATSMKDAVTAQAAIKEVRTLAARFHNRYPQFADEYVAICDVLEGKTRDSVSITYLDKYMEQLENKLQRCNFEYFFGRAYDLAGNKKLSDINFKRCMRHGPYDCLAFTLAGKYLADRYKTSRPD